MSDDMTSDYEMAPLPSPSEALRRLGRLVGKWQVSGGAEGAVTYRWMDGAYFLLQDVELVQFGQPITGLELIGNRRPFGEDPHPEVTSRFYDSQGNTLDYTYDLDGDTLTIWAGDRGSPAYFRGSFNDDDSVMDGEWVYPGGGGYASTMRRVL